MRRIGVDQHAARPCGSASARKSAHSGSEAMSARRASTRAIGMNRPNSMAKPSDVWNQSLVTVRPPNALPLLLAPDV